MAEHGTISRYRGSKVNPPCRCAQCKSGWADYMRDRRSKNVAERTKTRVIRPASNVVAMPRANTPTHPIPPAAPDGLPGEQEQAVIARLADIECTDVALIARCRKMASILDNPDLIAMWGTVCRQLDLMMSRAETKKKKKSNQGRLAIMNSMNRPGRRTGTAE
jgi:hypothetical protein